MDAADVAIELLSLRFVWSKFAVCQHTLFSGQIQHILLFQRSLTSVCGSPVQLFALWWGRGVGWRRASQPEPWRGNLTLSCRVFPRCPEIEWSMNLIAHFFLFYAEIIQNTPSSKSRLQGVPKSEPCLEIPVKWSVLERSILQFTEVMPAYCELKRKEITVWHMFFANDRDRTIPYKKFNLISFIAFISNPKDHY